MTEIYGVTGMPLSGKTTVAEILGDEGYTVLDMGDVVRIEMEKRGIDAEKTGEFVNGLREEKGMDAIAHLSMPYLGEISDERDSIAITGMRSWEEKEKFEDETGEDIEVIAVWASRKTRIERKKERSREEDVKGDEFHERDIRDIENGVAKLMALSDYMVKNDGREIDELEEEVRKIVRDPTIPT